MTALRVLHFTLFVAASGFVLVLTLVSSLWSDSGGIVDLQSGCAVNNVSLTYINVFSNTHGTSGMLDELHEAILFLFFVLLNGSDEQLHQEKLFCFHAR